MDIWGIVITALVSPLVLKTFEYVTNKINSRDSETFKKISALEARVADLQLVNTENLIKIGMQQAKLEAQEKEIQVLQRQNLEKDQRIADLQNTVDVLTQRGKKK